MSLHVHTYLVDNKITTASLFKDTSVFNYWLSWINSRIGSYTGNYQLEWKEWSTVCLLLTFSHLLPWLDPYLRGNNRVVLCKWDNQIKWNLMYLCFDRNWAMYKWKPSENSVLTALYKHGRQTQLKQNFQGFILMKW